MTQRVHHKVHVAEELFAKRLPMKVAQLQTGLSQLRQHYQSDDSANLKEQIHQIMMLAQAAGLSKAIHHCKNLIGFLDGLHQSEPLEKEQIYSLITVQVEMLAKLYHPDDNILEASKNSLYHSKIVIGLSDNALAEEIAGQFSFFGYETLIAENLHELKSIVLAQHDLLTIAGVIMDLSFCPDLNTEVFDDLPDALPMVMVSDEDTVELRLFSVRIGGKAFFQLPVEFSTLLETIDDLVVPVGEASPYRVLMVEDSSAQAMAIKKILEKVNMIVEFVTNPLEISHLLEEFQPELILMDLYMPVCTGIELASVIRQQESYIGIPIVFLSSESNVETQMTAMRLGGDDFLTKPIEEDHLINAVTSRIDRYRHLRAEMIQDSLTGLLNHTRILEQLNQEVARSQRDQDELCFVMIDIDNFKMINDTYGHPVGDAVIKNLSRLIKQRVRKTDSVGRYGGEEFAVILPKSCAQSTMSIIEDIRKAFSKVVFKSNEGEEFQVSFSAGVSDLSETIASAEALIESADKALYTSKHNGKDRTTHFKP